jgi:hypothetical protein
MVWWLAEKAQPRLGAPFLPTKAKTNLNLPYFLTLISNNYNHFLIVGTSSSLPQNLPLNLRQVFLIGQQT